MKIIFGGRWSDRAAGTGKKYKKHFWFSGAGPYGIERKNHY